jgi:hypothetical protein
LAGFISTFPTKLYWIGVGMFLGGMLCLAIGAALEDWKIGWRLFACILWIALGVTISLAVVFVPAPLGIAANSYSGDYADKSDVYGITWEKGMSELRVVLINPTDNNYDDLDFNIVPDVETRKAMQITSVPNVSIMLGGESDGPIIADAHFLINGVEQPQPAYSSKNGFRTLCPRLPKHSKMEIVAALVNPIQIPHAQNSVTSILRSGNTEDFAGPKKVATRASIKGDYFVMNHPHNIDIVRSLKRP